MSTSTKDTKLGILLCKINLFALPVIISSIGYMIMASSVNNLFWGFDQGIDSSIINLLIGMLVALVISYIPKDKLYKVSPITFLVALAFILLLLTPFGLGNYNPKWIVIGELVFCPAKLIIPCYILFAGYLTKNPIPYIKKELSFHQKLWISTAVACVTIFLFSGYRIIALLVFAIAFCISFVYGNKQKHVTALAILLGVGVLLVTITTVVEAYYPNTIPFFNGARVMAWLFPEQYEYTHAYQPTAALDAIINGRIIGRGFGNGKLAQVLEYLPDDFMFAALVEDFGMLGGIVLITLLIILVFFLYEIYKIACDTGNRADQVVIFAVMAHITIAAVHNVAINYGIIPATTTEFPFLYSGKNSMFLWAEIGLVMNILNTWMKRVKEQEKEAIEETGNKQQETVLFECPSKAWLEHVSIKPRECKTFGNYHYDDESQKVFSACSTLKEHMGEPMVLYLHGEPGMGKTHLMESIVNDFSTESKRAVILNSRDLQQGYIQYIQKKGATVNMGNFVRELFEDVDLVCLEEVDWLKDHYMIQLTIDGIISLLCKMKKQVVLTSVLPPEEMHFSFHNISTYTSLKVPNHGLEVKVKIVEDKAKELEIAPTEEEIMNTAMRAKNGFDIDGRMAKLHFERRAE